MMRDARRARTPMTVLYFDLDGLKIVNDTLGHDVGSQLVVDFATLLRANCRATDVVARVGGDEFAVVLRNRPPETDAVLRRMEAATAAANSAGGKPYSIGYSVGEATGDPAGGESFAEIVTRADAAMYKQKIRKKSTPSPADAATRVPSTSSQS